MQLSDLQQVAFIKCDLDGTVKDQSARFQGFKAINFLS